MSGEFHVNPSELLRKFGAILPYSEGWILKILQARQDAGQPALATDQHSSSGSVPVSWPGERDKFRSGRLSVGAAPKVPGRTSTEGPSLSAFLGPREGNNLAGQAR